MDSGADVSTVDDGYGGLTLTSDADPGGDVCSSTSSHLVDERQEYRRSAECSGHLLGLFLRRLRPDHHQREWHHWLHAEHHIRSHRDEESRLHPAPPALPVLRLDRESKPYPPQSRWPRSARHGDAANHQYDIHDFFDAVSAGNFPAVSYLKAPGYQDGHAGYSDPLDEQTFIVNIINFLEAAAGLGQHRSHHHL